MDRYRTANFITTSKIRTIEELLNEKIVYVTTWRRISPVAFLQNWQARLLHYYIRDGYIYKVHKATEKEITAFDVSKRLTKS